MVRFDLNLLHRVSPVLAIGPKFRRFAETYSGLLDALELGTVGDLATVFFYDRGMKGLSVQVSGQEKRIGRASIGGAHQGPPPHP